MKRKILTSLLLSNVLFASDSIYDGTGSLIHPLVSMEEVQKGLAWGADRDEVHMQPHLNKTSTVTFQVLYDKQSCTHVDIHSGNDLEQDVIINLKAWDDRETQESFVATLPAGAYYKEDGVSLDISNYNWVTMSIITTKPLKEEMPIFAYCRDSLDTKNTKNILKIERLMTKLNTDHYYMGNGSLISMLETDNGQWGYGTIKDEALASNTKYDTETSFQIQGSKKCQKVKISDLAGITDVEEILYKGWDKKTWRKSNCIDLPCELDTFFISEERPNYFLVNVKTRKSEDNRTLSVECISKTVKIDIHEKPIEYKHPNKCKFDDDITENQKYITAICSAEIISGDEESNYREFKADTNVTWEELTQAVELSYHFAKMKDIRSEYPNESKYQAYLDEAKKIGFDYPRDEKITLGIALKYIVSKFWERDLNEENSIEFIDKKINLTNTEPSSKLERGYMSYIVLKSARVSSDDNSVDRSLVYVNHENKDLDTNGDSDIPASTFKDVTIETDTTERNNIIQENIEEAIKSDATLSENNETSNTALAIKIIAGGEDGLKDEYQDKTAEEIFEEAEDNGVETTIEANVTKRDTTILELYQNELEEEILIVSSTDTNGENTKAIDNGEKIEKVTEADLNEQGYVKIKEMKAQNLLVEPITPLEIPTNLIATSKEYEDKIEITWSPVNNIEKYYVYRSKSPAGEYEQIDSTSSESYSDKDIKIGKKYYYKVRSFISEPSQLSEYSEYTDGETMEKIKVVSQLQATDKEFEDKIEITWNGTKDASEYYVYRSSSDEEYEEIGKTKLASYSDINLDSNSTFYYKVKTLQLDRLSEYSFHDKGETKEKEAVIISTP